MAVMMDEIQKASLSPFSWVLRYTPLEIIHAVLMRDCICKIYMS